MQEIVILFWQKFHFSPAFKEEDMALTSSLPDGLDNVAEGAQSVTGGSNPRTDKKRLSIRLRNKLASLNAAPSADSD